MGIFEDNFAKVCKLYYEQEKLAASDLQITPQQLSKIMNGTRRPTIPLLQSLREKKKIDLNWLICGESVENTNQRADQPYICHLLFQDNQKLIADIFISFFQGLGEAVSFCTQKYLLPGNFGNSEVLAQKHVNEATTVLCILSHGHHIIQSTWKEIAKADNEKGDQNLLIYGITASANASKRKLPWLNNISKERIFNLDDESMVKKIITIILDRRVKKKGVSLHFDDAQIADTARQIAKFANRRVIFIAGSIPDHVNITDSRLPKKIEEAKRIQNLVYWSKQTSQEIQSDRFFTEYCNYLKRFCIALCKYLGKKFKFQLCSSALVENVGKEIIKYCEQNRIDAAVEGMFSLKGLNDTDGFYKKYLEIARTARMNYLREKEAIIIIGGNEGTYEDILAVNELNKQAQNQGEPQIKIICIPCFGGQGALNFYESFTHKPNSCLNCVKNGIMEISEKCIKSIFDTLSE